MHLSEFFENVCRTSTSINSSFLFILAIANPLKRSSLMVDLKYDLMRFNVENVLSGVAEVIGNVTNNFNSS